MHFKQKMLRVLFCVELLIFCCFYFFGAHGFRAVRSLQHENGQIELAIAEAQNEVGALEQQIDSWRQDPFFTEKYAREKLAMARPGEIMYVTS